MLALTRVFNADQDVDSNVSAGQRLVYVHLCAGDGAGVGPDWPSGHATQHTVNPPLAGLEAYLAMA